MGLSLEEYAAQQEQQNIERAKENFADNQTGNAAARSPLERQQAQTKADQARAFDVYKQYQQNTILTETLDTEIIKGLQVGEPLPSLFLKAMKAFYLCKSKMPSDWRRSISILTRTARSASSTSSR